jgi:hypothetical protein
VPKISRRKHFSHTLCSWGIASNTYGHSIVLGQSGAYARAQAVQWPGVFLKGKSRTSLHCTDLEFHPLSLLSAVSHLLLRDCSPDAPVR